MSFLYININIIFKILIYKQCIFLYLNKIIKIYEINNNMCTKNSFFIKISYFIVIIIIIIIIKYNNIITEFY